ncbi:MAG: glycosyltransferase [Holophagaceae bacterium]
MTGAGPRSLHVVASLDPRSGGPARSILALCDALNALGACAEVATVAAEGEPSMPPTSTPRHRFPLAGPQKLRRSPALAEFLRRELPRFDLVHLHGLWQWPTYAARRTAEAAGRPWAVSPRGMLEPWSLTQRRWVKQAALATWEGRTLRGAALLHATSEAEAAQFRALGFGNPVAVLPNIVAVPPAAPEPTKDAPPRLLFLSRLHPKKGIEPLVRVWARVAPDFPGWSLQVHGPDPDGLGARLRGIAVQHGLAEEAFHLGSEVEGEAKEEAFRRADLFVLPTRSENFGNAVAEALARGVPVITTTGAPWEGLRREDCGWWIPPEEAALERALREALALPPETRRAMGLRGRAWMVRDFGPDRVARGMIQAYEALRPGGLPSESRHDSV